MQIAPPIRKHQGSEASKRGRHVSRPTFLGRFHSVVKALHHYVSCSGGLHDDTLAAVNLGLVEKRSLVYDRIEKVVCKFGGAPALVWRSGVTLTPS